MNHQNLPIALSIDEAARQANVCRDKLYQAIKRGELKAKKAGRRTLILRSDLEAFLADLPQLKLSPANTREKTLAAATPVECPYRGGR